MPSHKRKKIKSALQHAHEAKHHHKKAIQSIDKMIKAHKRHKKHKAHHKK
jgi:hypothetical protein